MALILPPLCFLYYSYLLIPQLPLQTVITDSLTEQVSKRRVNNGAGHVTCCDGICREGEGVCGGEGGGRLGLEAVCVGGGGSLGLEAGHIWLHGGPSAEE